jgi:hypothetical protein
MTHHFSTVDRGAGHIHRYTPSCSCGWVGQHRPTVDLAKASHREHVGGIVNRRLRGHPARPNTPLEDLPEVLR